LTDCLAIKIFLCVDIRNVLYFLLLGHDAREIAYIILLSEFLLELLANLFVIYLLDVSTGVVSSHLASEILLLVDELLCFVARLAIACEISLS